MLTAAKGRLGALHLRFYHYYGLPATEQYFIPQLI